MKKKCLMVCGMFFFALAAVCTASPGQNINGKHGFVTYMEGSLPIIISVPHGGTMDGTEAGLSIPDHDGEDLNDYAFYTQILAVYIRNALHELTGQYPHVIFNNLLRGKLDANRDGQTNQNGKNVTFAVGSATQDAWREYHGFIDRARHLAIEAHGTAYYIDLHAHWHPHGLVELGYGPSFVPLSYPDDSKWVNWSKQLNSCTFKNLYDSNYDSPDAFTEMLRGKDSLGDYLEKEKIACTPCPKKPSPGILYFNGGYSVHRHCLDRAQQADVGVFTYPSPYNTDNDSTNGVQIEVPSQVVTLEDPWRPNTEGMFEFSEDLARALCNFFETYYFDITN